MKNIHLGIIFFIISSFISQTTFSQARWWQREIPAPSYNQIINPDYLSVKRDLERTLDDKNGLIERSKKYSPGSREEGEYKRMIGMSEGRIWDLEDKLSKTPMYIDNPNFDKKSNTEDSKSNNITIINEQPTSTKSTYNTKVLTGGGKNLQSKIQFDELKDYISSKSLSTDEKISYYEAFIKDWPNTDATTEAKEIIKGLQTEGNSTRIVTQPQRSKEDELDELNRTTAIIIKLTIIGNLSTYILQEDKSKCFNSGGFGTAKNSKYYFTIRSWDLPIPEDFYWANESPEREYIFKSSQTTKWVFDPNIPYDEKQFHDLKFGFYIFFDTETYISKNDKNTVSEKEMNIKVPVTLGLKTILNLRIFIESNHLQDIKIDIEQVK
jgi:hypothetical protein